LSWQKYKYVSLSKPNAIKVNCIGEGNFINVSYPHTGCLVPMEIISSVSPMKRRGLENISIYGEGKIPLTPRDISSPEPINSLSEMSWLNLMLH
jgi:hypothetical protein